MHLSLSLPISTCIHVPQCVWMCTLVHVCVQAMIDNEVWRVCVCISDCACMHTLNISHFLYLWSATVRCVLACMSVSLTAFVCVCMLPKVKINSGSKCMCPCMFISIYEHTMQYRQQKMNVGLLYACLFHCVSVW